MATTDFTSVNDYIAAQPRSSQSTLRLLRRVIRKAIPEADELISYQIPAYTLKGERVIYFAGWKAHYSLYPATAGVIAAFRDELASYQVSKGTIRFPITEPIPVRLIAGIAKVRAKEARARMKARPVKKKAR